MSQHDKNHSAERRPTKDARRRMSAYRKGVEAGRAEALAGIESRLERLEFLIRASLGHADLETGLQSQGSTNE